MGLAEANDFKSCEETKSVESDWDWKSWELKEVHREKWEIWS